MADDFGPNLNAHVPYLDQIGVVVPVDRARGTTPLAPPRGPKIGKDGVRLTERSKKILSALAKGDADLDDPDFMRLRQLYQRAPVPEQAPPDHEFPPELLALVQSYGDTPALPGGQGPTARAGDFLSAVGDRLRRAYHALIL
jgi:hypothetical protein